MTHMSHFLSCATQFVTIVIGTDRLFISDPRHENRCERNRQQDSPERTEGDRSGQVDERGGGVHRMAHHGIGSGRDDLLSRFDFDDPRCPAVLVQTATKIA